MVRRQDSTQLTGGGLLVSMTRNTETVCGFKPEVRIWYYYYYFIWGGGGGQSHLISKVIKTSFTSGLSKITHSRPLLS